jgi:hypothetical protein
MMSTFCLFLLPLVFTAWNKAFKLYTTTIIDFKLMVKEVHILMTLEEYIRNWRLEVWETFFFKSSSPRMVFIITKHGNNNLEERRPSKEFFIGVNLNLLFCI